MDGPPVHPIVRHSQAHRREEEERGGGEEEEEGENGERNQRPAHTHTKKKKGVQEIVRKKKGFKVSHVHMNET